ncbi:hypothetical protein Pcinc_042985 [Petrolisthes cinctipes]|uniref:Uncharacterized protein n=1 Tax=Petrolisthes cinctipes TaxID=88211 RepID=A0AAE1BIF9_PETCI|nr:hypothetical protein Pcinc_042985 [Petrolisthes cinctipes]
MQRRALRLVEAAGLPIQPPPTTHLDSLEHHRDVAALVTTQVTRTVIYSEARHGRCGIGVGDLCGRSSGCGRGSSHHHHP